MQKAYTLALPPSRALQLFRRRTPHVPQNSRRFLTNTNYSRFGRDVAVFRSKLVEFVYGFTWKTTVFKFEENIIVSVV